MDGVPLTSARVSADGYDEAQEYFYAQGMTDGLPITPPTEERVAAMVAASGRAADESLGTVHPAVAEATVEKVAVNAVMAGCLPEYMPVVAAAVEAMTEEEFLLYSIQTTTNPVGVGVIVNGPIRNEIGINSGASCLGPGNRANASIGRAIRLVLLNIGGAAPGEIDKATQGFPGKFTLCFGENEELSPWAPLHVERGFDAEESCVTVIAPNATLNCTYGDRTIAEDGMAAFAATMTAPAITQFSLFTGEPLFLLNPGHARALAAGGWSKDDVKRYFHEHTRLPGERISSVATESSRHPPRPDRGRPLSHGSHAGALDDRRGRRRRRPPLDLYAVVRVAQVGHEADPALIEKGGARRRCCFPFPRRGGWREAIPSPTCAGSPSAACPAPCSTTPTAPPRTRSPRGATRRRSRTTSCSPAC